MKNSDFVTIDFENRPEFIFIWFALSSLGAIPAFINHHLRGEALRNVVTVAGAKLLLVDPAIWREVGPCSIEGVQKLEVRDAEVIKHNPFREEDSQRACGLNDTAILIYTSGTTGASKAAIVSNGKAHNSCRTLGRIVGFTP